MGVHKANEVLLLDPLHIHLAESMYKGFAWQYMHHVQSSA